MKKRINKRVLSGLLAFSCVVSALPVIGVNAEDTPAVKDIYVSDFEDGDVSAFSKRGDTDTSMISAGTGEAHSGTGFMSVIGRTKGWNGPQIKVDELCEPGVKYSVSAWVKTAWYNACKISMQYTDENGDVHYNNLGEAVSQGEWVQIPEVKFSYSEEMKDVYIYIECNDSTDLYVDDFAIRTTPVYNIQQDIVSLKDAYQDYFKIGGAVTADELSPQATKDLILKHYNSITLGNELKPENMLDQKACQESAAAGDNRTVAVSLNGAARTILNFCRDNHIPVRGHVLVWHSQTPGWFFKEDYTTEGEWVDKETMLARMESYIKGVMEVLQEEYPDVDFYAWDVVNEAWLDDGSARKPGMYDENSNYSGWTAVFGDNSFIPYAFEYARKYAPEGCKLYYNDFNEYMPQKTEAIVKMAEELKEKDLIDGIGMQSHLDVTFPGISAYKKAVDSFAKTGLDIQVTELDATTADISEAGFAAQAQYYSDIMDVLVEYADHISAVVFWGTTDDMSWRAAKSPLLFNEDYTAKPAFYSIVDGLDVPDTSESESESDSDIDPEILWGDADLSGAVNILDVILINRTILGRDEMTEEQLKAADVNQNQVPDSTDALNILKLIVGLLTPADMPIAE